MTKVLTILALLALSVEGGAPPPTVAARPHQPELVSLEEAEILIYLTPQVQAARGRGDKVAWDAETSPYWNGVDFFNFWVVLAPAGRGPAITFTLCWCSVNKHTADVVAWGTGTGEEELVEAPELEGVQAIVRKARYIDQATIDEYRKRRVQN